MAKDVPQMLRGWGMANRFLKLLIEMLEENGGTEEMLYLLTTESGRDNLDKLAKSIASFTWKVPVSIVKMLAREDSLRLHPDGEHVYADQNFMWTPALKKLNIPFVAFAKEIEQGSEDRVLPPELREQLHGKTISPHMPLEWEGEQYILVEIAFGSGGIPHIGDELNMDAMHPREDFLCISRVEHFDLEN